MKIRILLLVTDLNTGGTPLSVKQLACGLNKDRFDVSVACLAPSGAVAQQLRQCNIPVYCLGAVGRWDIRVFYRLLRLLIKIRPHILHTFLVHANIAGRITGRVLWLPCIIGSIRTVEKTRRWHLIAENITFRMGRLTLCNSQSVYNHTKRFSYVPDRYLQTIINGVDIKRFSEAVPVPAAEIGLQQGKTTLIFVGRLDPVKNLDTLLYALQKLLLQDSNNNLQLLVVGDGPQKHTLVNLVKKLHLENEVVLAGFRNDVERLLKTSDIFVMPSHQEGCSGATLEAMARGIPIIAARSPGLYDLITHQKTGLLFSPNDITELTSRIETLINHPQLAQKLARNAQHLCCDRFSLNEMINNYTRLYNDIYTQRR